jgi:hypothetical protein
MAEEQLHMEFVVDEKDYEFWEKTVDYVSTKYPRLISRPRATVFKIIELLMSFFLMNILDMPVAIAGDIIFLIIILHTSLAKHQLSLTYNFEPLTFETNENILYIVQALANAQSVPIFNLRCAQMTQETCNFVLKFLVNKTGKTAKRIVMERVQQLSTESSSENSESSESSDSMSTESSSTTTNTSESNSSDT